MVSERLKTLFGKVKKGLGEKLSETKPEDVAKFAAKEAAGAIPFVGQIIKNAFDEFSEDEKEELVKELKELSESQFKEISEKVGFSVEYLKDIQGITLYFFEELRADHEEIKELIRSLIEIQIRGTEVKPPEINIPTIQSVLRKGETFEGDFFKKEPEWIDFEWVFVVERKEVDEIMRKLENDNIQLVLGDPASGKSVILKNIGFKLVKNKDVYVVEHKKHSSDEVKRYFEDILEIKDENTVFIVDDAHLLPTECERLVREFKNRKLKAKLIIGSRETRKIRGEHPKERSEFEYLSKTDIHAEDVTEEMVRVFLKRKYDFSDERIERVSKNLEKYKKDLWFLAWALKAYNPKKDSIKEEEIYEKIRDSIRNISAGEGKPRINAEDVFLPLSVFYRFEIPIERWFLEEQIGLEENIINQLIALSEITEMEERGKRRTLSLSHSSIAELYFKAYQNYPDLGRKVKEIFQDGDIEYSMFHQYITSMPTNSLNAVIHLGRDWYDNKGGRTLLKNLIGDLEIKKSIREGFEKEEDIEKIGLCAMDIAWAGEEVRSGLVNRIDTDILSSKIEKEEDIKTIESFARWITIASKELGLKLASTISSKIVKEKDLKTIGWYVWDIAEANEDVGLKLANQINIDILSSKIEKQEDIWKIGWCVRYLTTGSGETGFKLVNSIDINLLLSKIEREEDMEKVGSCVWAIAAANKEVALKLVEVVSSKIENEEDIGKIGVCMRYITNGNEEVALKLVDAVSSKIEKEENIEKIGWCMWKIAEASEEVAQEIVNHLNPKLREELRKRGWLK